MIQKIIYSLITALLLSGCILEPDNNNFSINAFDLSEECPNVCWLRIQPNITLRDEAITILNSNSQVAQETLHIVESDLRFLWFTNNQTPHYSRIRVATDNSIVSSISFVNLYPITVGDFIMLFGEPDEISISLEVPPDAIYINYILYFSDIQVMMDVVTSDFSGPKASDSPKFLGINLEFDGDELVAWRAEKYTSRQPWLGYGHIKDYLPGQKLPRSR